MKNKILNFVCAQVGLGEFLHFVFYPLALLLGRVNCKPCACRRFAFNVVVPDINPFSVVRSLVRAFKDCSCDCDK